MNRLFDPLFILKYGPKSDPHMIAISPFGMILFAVTVATTMVFVEYSEGVHRVLETRAKQST